MKVSAPSVLLWIIVYKLIYCYIFSIFFCSIYHLSCIFSSSNIFQRAVEYIHVVRCKSLIAYGMSVVLLRCEFLSFLFQKSMKYTASVTCTFCIDAINYNILFLLETLRLILINCYFYILWHSFDPLSWFLNGCHVFIYNNCAV